MSMFKKSLIGLAAAGSMAVSFSAMATNGILPLGNGMVAHGFGGAGIANGAETMSAVDNPALANQVSNSWSAGISLFNPNRSINLGGGYTASDNDFFFIPQGGWLTKINDKMSWGVVAYAMGGMNTEYPANTFGPGTPKVGIDLSGLIIAPTFSYKLNNDSSIGISLLYGYAKLATKGPALSPPLPDTRSDSATGTGFKLGYAINMGATNIGVTYQTEISMDKMEKHCAYMFGSASDCSLNLPPQYGIGITHKLSGNTKIVADILQVNWSEVAVFKEIFEWEDQTILKFGMEFEADSNTAYRIGWNHGASPVPDNKVQTNALAPAITEDHLTLGMTKKMGSGSEVSGYFAYVFENEQTDSGTGAKAKMDQFAIGVGYNVSF
ncbi:MAG: outer membrane protein transport protein [Gammaproteobacteria bacterium]|nr:outer membrane protein transport protein [Gammaproteobacteria bacterium]MDH5650884.1 outer membrane protein transport protein [Gammaproteobacteria bacterium]